MKGRIQFLLLSVKFSTLWFVWGLLMVTSAAHPAKIDLPKDAVILEANAGKMEKGVTIVKDKGASEGKSTDHARGAKTVHEIEIPKTGDWYLWIRIFCPDPSKDSYWVGKSSPKPC